MLSRLGFLKVQCGHAGNFSAGGVVVVVQKHTVQHPPAEEQGRPGKNKLITFGNCHGSQQRAESKVKSPGRKKKKPV